MRTWTQFLALAALACVLATSSAQAQVYCHDLFTATQAFVTVPAPGRSRIEFLEVGKRFQDTPVNERIYFRDPVYTRFAEAAIQDLETKFTAHRKKEKPFGWLSSKWFRDRAFNSHMRESIRLLRRKTNQETKRGELSSTWGLKIAAHVGELEHLLYLYEINAATWDEKISALQRFDKNEERYKGFPTPNFIAAPTHSKFSFEGIMVLMAHGVRVYRLPRDRSFSTSSYGHDVGHAQLWSQALHQSVLRFDPNFQGIEPHVPYTGRLDLTTSPIYLRIFERLEMLTARLQTLPDYDRRAAFAVLFYMFHEYPEKYLDQLATEFRLTRHSLRLVDNYPNGNLNNFLSDDDLGYGFPTVPFYGGRAGSVVVKDAEQIVHLGLELIQNASEGL